MTATVTTPVSQSVRQLTVETTLIDEARPLIPFTDAHEPLLWMRKGNGLAGIGTALRLEFRGETRMRDAALVWQQLASNARVTDDVRLPGTGLIAFGAFTFADTSALSSVLIVPRVVVGRRDGVTWLTTVSETGDDGRHVPGQSVPDPGHRGQPRVPAPTALGPEYRISLLPGELDPKTYRDIVASAVEHIVERDLSKVVLARDLVGHLPVESDLRRVLIDLAVSYPDCWTYAVDGLVGASPETLVRVNHGQVSARVLAGTISRGADAQADRDSALSLAMSTKDQNEHQFAAQSVEAALLPHTSVIESSELPFTLKLPNLWHLATDIVGTLSDGSTSLDLIDALHPTAAVAGTPSAAAVELIHELEPFDRGRYAGPVGWVGADGDGEWAIALRGAQVSPRGDITAYAGAGIVAGSDPEHELAETKMKFRPIVDAFG